MSCCVTKRLVACSSWWCRTTFLLPLQRLYCGKWHKIIRKWHSQVAQKMDELQQFARWRQDIIIFSAFSKFFWNVASAQQTKKSIKSDKNLVRRLPRYLRAGSFSKRRASPSSSTTNVSRIQKCARQPWTSGVPSRSLAESARTPLWRKTSAIVTSTFAVSCLHAEPISSLGRLPWPPFSTAASSNIWSL